MLAGVASVFEEKVALKAEKLEHRYGKHQALSGLELEVASEQVFAILGPNGSGKTTLFRLAGTLVRVQQGELNVFGRSVTEDTRAVRGLLGVVFQSPSLDPKLTVEENINCQAALYGLSGASKRDRIAEVMAQLGISDRAGTPTDELSGGLKRRVELAKGVLHRPKLLLMDEPSSGLDPAARLDLWHAVRQLQQESGVTVVLTTHLLEEADKADRIAIMHRGQVVAEGLPEELRCSLGGQILTVVTQEPQAVKEWLDERGFSTRNLGHQIQIVGPQVEAIVAPLAQEFSGRVLSITLGQPSLEDVFVDRTGHRFWNEKTETTKHDAQRKQRS